MKFSLFYQIQHRDEFFEKFFLRNLKKCLADIDSELLYDKYFELMEIVLKMILDKDKDNLVTLLTKTNGKVARQFFDYFTMQKTKNMKKSRITEIVNTTIDDYIMEDSDEL